MADKSYFVPANPRCEGGIVHGTGIAWRRECGLRSRAWRLVPSDNKRSAWPTVSQIYAGRLRRYIWEIPWPRKAHSIGGRWRIRLSTFMNSLRRLKYPDGIDSTYSSPFDFFITKRYRTLFCCENCFTISTNLSMRSLRVWLAVAFCCSATTPTKEFVANWPLVWQKF